MSQPSGKRKARRRETRLGSRADERARRLVNQGARLIEQGRSPDAIPLLVHALQLDAHNTSALINLGGAYVMAGRHKEAIPVLEAAREADPLNPMAWINLGAAYLGNPVLATPEQQLRAIDAFETALKLSPAAPSVHYNLGLIHVDRGNVELALSAFRRALQTNPMDRDAQLWLRKLEANQ